ncbi:hypothetical protein Q7P37_007263 [Cladosporium fusiforme]
MPPIRSAPAAKPVKTERSHEENQERAYIAASRRSDRSLEARIESARRASEIHKRRTGRSLRVTEADVINEEMYEEEDDDLPMQYRRLTAHLQTQNADFDRRLAAYLTNHVAMRSALGQAVSDAWQNNQFNNIGQFMNPGMMQGSPQQPQQQQQSMQSAMLPPQMSNRSPTTHRQTPYPVANAQGVRPQHGRSASIATPQDFSFQNFNAQSAMNSPVQGIKTEDRRMSMPASNAMPQTPLSDTAPSTSNHNSPSANKSTNQQPKYSSQQPSPSAQSETAPWMGYASGLTAAQQNAINPLSATLPMESQQLLAANPFDFSLNDSMPTASQGNPMKQTYSYNPNGNSTKSKPSSPSDPPMMPQMTMGGFGNMPGMSGMDSTLAPSAFDMNGAYDQSPADSAFSPAGQAFGGMGFNNNDMFSSDFNKESLGGVDNLSGTVTPGENDWTGFLANDVWDEQQPVA